MTDQLSQTQFFDKLRQIGKRAEDFAELDGRCVYVHAHSDALRSIGTVEDVVVDGALYVLISRGNVMVGRNANEYRIQGPAVVFFAPSSRFSMGCIEADEAEMHILGFSRKFMEDLNLSLTALSQEEFITPASPEIVLTEQELAQELRYIKIIRTVLADDFNFTLNCHIVSSLVTSMIYQTTVYGFKRQGTQLDGRIPSRRLTYVREFVRLVHLNYTKERSVTFYAGKLCISPKYLSILVKEGTGRSAAAWIDYFVIMEAKNLLRFSGKNVQQVAYALNFANQSSFGKYFKHITGMSPSEYQRKG